MCAVYIQGYGSADYYVGNNILANFNSIRKVCVSVSGGKKGEGLGGKEA